MKLTVYFPEHKILVEGIGVLAHNDFRDRLSGISEGRIVVRKMPNDEYELTMNRYLEAEIWRLQQSELTNQKRRMYQLLGTRESEVLTQILQRVDPSQFPPENLVEESRDLWHTVLDKGQVCQPVDCPDFALDWLAWQDQIEYASEGYYTVSSRWIQKIISKKTHSMKVIKGEFNTSDEERLDGWMADLGFERKGAQYKKVSVPKSDMLFR